MDKSKVLPSRFETFIMMVALDALWPFGLALWREIEVITDRNGTRVSKRWRLAPR